MRQAMEAANEYKSQVNIGNGVKARLNYENEQLHEKLHHGESAIQAKLRGAELYRTNVMSNRDGQIQALRSQMQQFPESESKEEWVKSAKALAEQEASVYRLLAKPEQK